MSSDDDLFDQMGLTLKDRPGWRYEPSTTPGAQPSWCLTGDGEILLSVTVIDGVRSVYLPNEDVEIDFDNSEGLMAWIDENEDRFSTR
ncbi:MAG: hypothetical protein ABSF33_14335 [Acidimicrobiales bacterium]|jgi:hypothetical protein